MEYTREEGYQLIIQGYRETCTDLNNENKELKARIATLIRLGEEAGANTTAWNLEIYGSPTKPTENH